MKKVLYLILATLLVSGLILSGCSEPAAETTEPTPAATAPAATAPAATEPIPAATTPAATAPAATEPATEPAAEPINLVVNAYFTPTTPPCVVAAEWAAKIEEASGGAITFTNYYSSGLFTPVETLRSMLEGVADIQLSYTGREDTSIMTLNSWWSIPFLGFKSQEEGTYIAQNLFETFPELEEEYQGLVTYAPRIVAEPTCWHFVDKEVTDLAGMQGVKLLAIGKESKWMANMDAVPVTVAYPDSYISLQKGLVDADFLGMGSVIGLNTIELYKYALDVPGIVSCSFAAVLFNPESWANLPPDIQKLIEDLEPWYAEQVMVEEHKLAIAGRAMMEEAGIVFNAVSEEDMEQEWKPIFMPEHEDWIAAAAAKGKDGQAVYDEIQRLIANYSE